MAGQRPLAARTAESVRKVRGVAADVVMLNRLSKVSSRIKGCRLETHEIVAIVVLPRIFGDIHRLHHTAFIKLRPNSHIKKLLSHKNTLMYNEIINKDNEWECPNCGNKDHNKMTVVRRTCGYLGENFWNVGKTKEIKQRVMHL